MPFSNELEDDAMALVDLAHLLRDSGYTFTTVTPATRACVNARPESEWAKNARDVFGWSRRFQPGVLPARMWELMRRANIVQPHGDGWKSTLRASNLCGQLFWHSAFPTTDADSVFFGPDTSRFALAIEAMLAQEARPVLRAADVGCGAGPGAILVALARPQAHVFALDINPSALRLARINALIAGAPNVEARESNLLGSVEGDLDLIVANPPYLVDPSERAYRHGGGPLGAGLSLAIVEAALTRLNRGGTLLLYTGAAMLDGRDPFREAVEELLNAANVRWHYSETDPDIFCEELAGGAYANCDRIAAVVLRVVRDE